MTLINKKAPNFKAIAIRNGKEENISLSDFIGKKVVLYFYPKDLTPGCTIQACNLRDNFEKFKKDGIIVIGVSIDSIKSHLNFIGKKELPFILVSDEDKKIVEKYEVWGEKSFMGRKYLGTTRKTFLINEKGIIVHIIDKPSVNSHSEEIFNLLKIK